MGGLLLDFDDFSHFRPAGSSLIDDFDGIVRVALPNDDRPGFLLKSGEHPWYKLPTALLFRFWQHSRRP